MIVAAASCFSWVLTKEQIPQTFANWMTNTISNKYVFLLVVNIFLIIVGMFVEGNASMIVLGPLLHPGSPPASFPGSQGPGPGRRRWPQCRPRWR